MMIGWFPIGGAHAALTVPDQPPRASAVRKILDGQAPPPTTHALLIGINTYRHWTPLEWPQADIDQLAAALRRHYGVEDIRFLRDEAATRASILKELDRLAKTLTEHDALLIYFAGHGYSRGAMYDAYWIPSDGRRQISSARAEQEWISNTLLKGCLARLRTSQVLVISDSCFSPTQLQPREVEGAAKTNGRETKESAGRSWWCLASGYAEEVPSESRFSNKLVELLLAPRQGAFTVMDLAGWMREDLPDGAGAGLLAGAINSTATRSGNDFVFLRNEVRPPSSPSARAITPDSPAAPLSAQPPSSPSAGPVKLEAMVSSGGLADQSPVPPAASAVRQLADQQRESDARLEWDERQLVDRLTEGRTVGPSSPETAPATVPRGDPAALAVAAHALVEKGDLAGAAAVYLAILKQQPDHLIALSNLGVVRYNQGRLNEAEKAFRDALKLDFKDAFSRSMLGMVLAKAKRPDEAIPILIEVLAVRPDDAILRNWLGLAYRQKGNYEAAERELRRAVQIDPDYADAHFNLALVYLEENPQSLELARFHYNAARKLNMPPDPLMENDLKR